MYMVYSQELRVPINIGYWSIFLYAALQKKVTADQYRTNIAI